MRSNKIFRILGIATILSILTACTDEDIIENYEGRSEQQIELKLNFRATTPEVKVSSRALDEYAVKNLYVFIFNADGDLRTSKFYSYDDLTKGEIGSQPDTKGTENWIKIKTTTGPSRIYAIANVDESVNIYGDVVNPLSQDDEKKDDEKKDLKTQLGYITTEDELKALSLNIKESVNRVGECYVMAGVANEGKACTIGITNTDPNPILIKLHRLDAEITFKFKAGTGEDNHCESFEVTSFQVFNVPNKTYVLDRVAEQRVTPIKDGKEEIVSWDAANAEEDFFNTLESTDVFPMETKDEGKYTTFTFYMAENRKNAKNNINNYSGREEETEDEKPKDSTNPNANSRKYKNAPNYGTYVLVKGKFVGKSVKYEADSDPDKKQYSGEAEANVRYIIHLGYVGEKATDFFCNRNTKYTYNVTVYGVENIVVEVVEDKEEAPGAEGDVLFNNGKGIYKLDAHYETVLLSFKKSELENGAKNSLDEYFSYQIKTPYGNYTKTLTEKDGWKKVYQDENKKEEDEGWIRIRRNEINNEGVYSSDLGLYNKIGEENEYLTIQGLMEELKKIGQNEEDYTNLADKNGNIVYTCHINEFYYGKKNWNTFVNTDNRELHILNQEIESDDKLSTIISSAYIISQRSIQTFYRTDGAKGDFNAYGAETINETGALDSYKYYHTQIDQWGNTNLDSGRENFKTILEPIVTLDVSQWSDYVNWAENGYTNSNTQDLPKVIAMRNINNKDDDKENYQRAYLGCMQRNRDLDGNGTISDNEIRWYLPAQNQYVGMFLGIAGLSDESKLYPNSETQYKHIHYVSSTVYDDGNKGRFDYKDDDKRHGDGLVIYWAEEAVSTSQGGWDVAWNQNYDGEKHQYRCMRNLYNGKEVGDTGDEIQPFYKVEGTNTNGQGVKVTVPYLNTASLRSELVNRGELGIHRDNQNESRIATTGFTTGPRVDKDFKGWGWNIPKYYLNIQSQRQYRITEAIDDNPNNRPYKIVKAEYPQGNRTYRLQYRTEDGRQEVSIQSTVNYGLWDMNNDNEITCGFAEGDYGDARISAEMMRTKYVEWLQEQYVKDEEGNPTTDEEGNPIRIYTETQINMVKELPLDGDFDWNTNVFLHFFDFETGNFRQAVIDDCDIYKDGVLNKDDIEGLKITSLDGTELWDYNDKKIDQKDIKEDHPFYEANSKENMKKLVFNYCDTNKDGVLDEKDITGSITRLAIENQDRKQLWDMNFDGQITAGIYSGKNWDNTDNRNDASIEKLGNLGDGDFDSNKMVNTFFPSENQWNTIFDQCDINDDNILDERDRSEKFYRLTIAGAGWLWDMNYDGEITGGYYPNKNEFANQTVPGNLTAFQPKYESNPIYGGDIQSTGGYDTFFDPEASNGKGIRDIIFNECDINKDGKLDINDIDMFLDPITLQSSMLEMNSVIGWNTNNTSRTPCNYIKEGGTTDGYWRVPNLRELYMMLIADDYLKTTEADNNRIIYNGEVARTQFRFADWNCIDGYNENGDYAPGDAHKRYGWYRYWNTKKINMQYSQYITVRCIRDNGTAELTAE